MNKYLFILTLLPTMLLGAQEYIKLSHQISDPFVRDFSRRAGVRLFGAGGGMMQDIDMICLTFVASYRLDLSAARRLYIDGVEDLLNRYNTSSTVRPYLHNFPFTTTNLSFIIAFEDRPGKFPPSNFVADVFCIRENLCYTYYDHNIEKLVDFYEEPYEEALRIVHAEREQANKNELSKTNNSNALLPGKVRGKGSERGQAS